MLVFRNNLFYVGHRTRYIKHWKCTNQHDRKQCRAKIKYENGKYFLLNENHDHPDNPPNFTAMKKVKRSIRELVKYFNSPVGLVDKAVIIEEETNANFTNKELESLEKYVVSSLQKQNMIYRKNTGRI